MPATDAQRLAERLAKILESDIQSPDVATLFAAIEKINHRLDKLEQASSNLQSAIGDQRSDHPSLDKFSVAEAIADELFAGIRREKACQFEPGKPCDHCSMCNSRGF